MSSLRCEARRCMPSAWAATEAFDCRCHDHQTDVPAVGLGVVVAAVLLEK